MITLRAPYGLLVQILGQPRSDTADKCSTWWRVESPVDPGCELIVRDWDPEQDETFSVNKFRGLPWYDWRVDLETAVGSREDYRERYCGWLSSQVIEAAKKVRILSPEARAQVNEQIRRGTPADVAMRSARWESPADIERRFAWPPRD